MKTGKAFWILTFLLVSYFTHSQTLVINEVQTDNVNVITDEDGDYSSWIEIYNPTNARVNLQDYGLSNDVNNPFLWTFPQLSIEANQYLLVFASGKDRKQYDELQWETLITQGDLWKYKVGDASIPSQWMTAAYDDASWQEGPSGFGYGDSDDATVLGSRSNPILSVYIRKKFTISNLNNIEELLLHIDYDDGFIAYLNGTEILRVNMGATGSSVSYLSTSSALHEANMYDGDPPSLFNIEKSYLQEGENILSIQGHNRSQTSSDLTLIPFLTVLMKEPPLKARGIPEVLQLSPKTPTLHTNFTLNTEKCTLTLTAPDGSTANTLIANNISSNDSKGLSSAGNVVMFGTPTPGAKNNDNRIVFGKLDDVYFSVESGFFSDAITLRLSSDYAEGIIRYTTDGSTPGKGSNIYNAPIRLNKTSVVKAYVFGGLYSPSDVSSKTYFINDKSTLPVVSLSFKPEDFFSNTEGIYVPGNDASETWPYANANYWKDAARDVFIEYFDEKGAKQFDAGANASIAGNESRTYPQKSLFISLKDNSSTYELFPGCAVNTLESFTLSNGNYDWAHTLLNESFMQNIVVDLDMDLRHRHPCLVYLNGEYWGIHEMKEDLNLQYLKRRSEISEDKASLLCYDLKLSPTIAFGQKKEYELLWNKVNNTTTLSNSQVNEFGNDIDLNNLVNYFIFQIYIANTQWPGKNQCFWHNGLETGKWRWIPTDFDRGFGLSVHGDYHYGHYNPNGYQHATLNKVLIPSGSQDINPYYSSLFIRRLLSNDAFKTFFINRFADLLNTQFLPENVIYKCDLKADKLANEIDRHYNKWKTSLILNSALEWKTSLEWDLRIASLKDFSTKRYTEMFKQLALEFKLSGKEQIVNITVNDPAKGYVKLNSLELTIFPWQGRYFADVPIKLTAIPKEGYRFSGWEGLEDTSAEIEVLPGKAGKIKAIFIKDDVQGIPFVTINELNYFSRDASSSGEWIELYNAGKEDVNLGAWVLNSDNGLFPYIFPENYILESGNYLVVSNNIKQFVSRHPRVYNVLGETDFKLNDTEGNITLYSNEGQCIDSVYYSSYMPWPECSAADAKTLALLSPFGNNLIVSNWRVADGYGTPGEANYDFYTDQKQTPFTPEISFYPNPAKERVYFNLPAHSSDVMTLTIFDQQGRIILRTTMKEMEISLGAYVWHLQNTRGQKVETGIYFCNFSGENINKTVSISVLP